MAICQNFLSEPEDWETFRTGFEMVREVAAQKPLDKFRGKELNPGSGCKTRSEIDKFIRRTAWTVHHPLGTCKMGGDGDEIPVPRALHSVLLLDACSRLRRPRYWNSSDPRAQASM